jgi:hypothetical protein
MTKTHAIGTFAAIGCLTATVALLAGLPAASADELADLRANQELLQRRIEQLAQAPNVYRGGGAGLSPLGTAASPGVAMTAGSFPRSFLIPGTDTSIRVGGAATLKLEYWLQNGPTNGNTTSAGINGRVSSQPLDIHGQTVPGLTTPGSLVPVQIEHSRGNGVWQESSRETRLNVETRTPTSWGEARTFIEMDFSNANNFNQITQLHVSDNLVPRLRYGYGTLGGFLAGQANSNFSDPDANPETVDFGGLVGQAGVVRIPQVRYTIAGPWGSAWSMSLEAPETDLLTPAGQVQADSVNSAPPAGPGIITSTQAGAVSCVANGRVVSAAPCTLSGNPTKNPAPDITFASYWAQPWGHVDFRLVGRDLEVTDGRFISKRFFGYGGGISGDVKPGWFGWGKDDFQWQFTAGNGIGRYLNDGTDNALATNFLSAPTTAAAARNIIVKPISEFGASVGYQHWWLPNLRSNISYGYAYYAVPSQLVGPFASLAAQKQLMNTFINLIWSPVAFVDTGIEYTWGQRMVLANIRGSEQALVGVFRVKF